MRGIDRQRGWGDGAVDEAAGAIRIDASHLRYQRGLVLCILLVDAEEVDPDGPLAELGKRERAFDLAQGGVRHFPPNPQNAGVRQRAAGGRRPAVADHVIGGVIGYRRHPVVGGEGTDCPLTWLWRWVERQRHTPFTS